MGAASHPVALKGASWCVSLQALQPFSSAMGLIAGLVSFICTRSLQHCNPCSMFVAKFNRNLLQELLGKYKFVLAFENSPAKDYVTEKLRDAFKAGTVPVVYHAPNIHDYEPDSKAIINADDFEYVQDEKWPRINFHTVELISNWDD
jgi:hypothetical protein